MSDPSRDRISLTDDTRGILVKLYLQSRDFAKVKE